jgi:membrane protein implicated in regulation of membrane protease activity
MIEYAFPASWLPEGVATWLEPGEQVVWTGVPNPHITFCRGDWFLVPLTVAWLGLVTTGQIGLLVVSGHELWWLTVVPLLALALYLAVGRFFYKRWDKSRSRYVLTNQRAAVFRTGKQFIREVPVRNRVRVTRLRGQGHGTITWSLSNKPTLTYMQVLFHFRDSWPDATTFRELGWPMGGRLPAAEVAFVDVDNFEELLNAVESVRGGPIETP